MADSDSRSPEENATPKARPSSGEEAARAVQEVLRDQAERKARQKEGSKRPEKKRLLPLPVVALMWGAACLVVWAATPEFLLPEPLPEPTPVEVETGLRMEMLSLIQEIEGYREQTGRVPMTLERVMDEPPPGVRYTALAGDAYRLTGQRGGSEIVYQSGDPVEELVGDVRRRIQGQEPTGGAP